MASSSAKALYKAIALVNCELIWLKQLLEVLKLEESSQIHLVRDNHIASPIFYEKTRHIEVDHHFMKEKLKFGDINTRFVNYNYIHQVSKWSED